MCFTSQAQISVSSSKIFNPRAAKKIKDSQLDAFKKTTTIFTLQFKDYGVQEDFEKMISSVWHVTDFKVVRPEELSQYLGKPQYSFFTFGGFMLKNSRQQPQELSLSYDLWMPNPKKPAKQTWQFGKVLLHMSAETLHDFLGHMNFRESFDTRVTRHAYQDGDLYSWGPGYLRGYIKEINDLLEKKKLKAGFEELADKSRLSSLKNDTLYIPEYVTIRAGYRSFGTDNTVDRGMDPELTGAYGHPVRIVTHEEMNDLILNSDKPIKYVVFIRNSSFKWVTVYDSADGSIIYSESNAGTNFRPKDLAKLSRIINASS